MIALTDIEKAKIYRLNEDPELLNGIKKVFLGAFLKRQGGDVQVLAAARLAVDLLDDGFRDLEKIKPEGKRTSKEKNPAR